MTPAKSASQAKPYVPPANGAVEGALVTREVYERLIHLTWADVRAAAERGEATIETILTSKFHYAPAGSAYIYQGRPNEVWLASQGW